MYEQAIIDAQQLRETAMKNAQQIVVEKYSSEIKEAVEKLLEQNEEESVVDSLPYSHESLVSEEKEEEDEGVHVIKKGKKGVKPSKDDEQEEEDEGSEPLMETKDLEALLEQALKEMEEEDEGHNALEDQLAEESYEYSDEEEDEGRMCEECGYMEEDCQCSCEHCQKPMHSCECEHEEESHGDEGGFYDESLEEEVEFDLEEALKFSGSSLSEPTGWLGSTAEQKDEAHEIAKVEAIARESQAKAKASNQENKELKSKVAEMEEKINKLTTENRTLSAKAEKLKVALQESNDLSNKLYYTNCVLKDDSLNERQKNTIVESLSKAKDAKEAKTIYETLRNAAGSNQSRKPKSLSEAVNRTTSLVIQPKPEKVEAGTSVIQERMMRLAGLI